MTNQFGWFASIFGLCGWQSLKGTRILFCIISGGFAPCIFVVLVAQQRQWLLLFCVAHFCVGEEKLPSTQKAHSVHITHQPSPHGFVGCFFLEKAEPPPIDSSSAPTTKCAAIKPPGENGCARFLCGGLECVATEATWWFSARHFSVLPLWFTFLGTCE